MPSKPPTPCRQPGCRGLVRSGVCSVCGPRQQQQGQVQYDNARGTAAQRGYGWRWQQLRAGYLQAHPSCAECAREGRIEAAVDVHHILPRRDGGSDDESNLMPLCHACHSRITAVEKTRQGTGHR